MQLTDYSSSLRQNNGIWRTDYVSEVSYPSGSNDECYQIEDTSFWFKHRNDCITAVVKKFYDGGNQEIFDIGGGNGFVSLALANAGYEPILVEPGIQGIANGKQRGLKNLVHASLEDIELKDGTVPAIGFFDVLEHVEDDRKFLTHVYRALKKGGLVFLTVPALTFLWSNDDVSAGHFRRYQTRSLELLLKSIGLEVIYSSYLFSGAVLPLFLLKSVPSFFGAKPRAADLQKIQRDHRSKGITKSLLAPIWAWELERVRAGKQIPIGSSILAAAIKV